MYIAKGWRNLSKACSSSYWLFSASRKSSQPMPSMQKTFLGVYEGRFCICSEFRRKEQVHPIKLGALEPDILSRRDNPGSTLETAEPSAASERT